MSDVRLTPERIVRAGIDLADTGSLSASNTYLVRNNGKVFLHFKKANAVNCVVTLITQKIVDDQAVADRTVTVLASGGAMHIGPFPPEIYNDSSRDLRFTLSDIDGLTVAVGQMP